MKRSPRATLHHCALGIVAVTLAAGCGTGSSTPTAGEVALTGRKALLLAHAVFPRNSSQPLPARVGILIPSGGGWEHTYLEDRESNVFHKAMLYPSPGSAAARILTLGGTRAAVKLWNRAGRAETLWEADFGGTYSRMRDAELASGAVRAGATSIIVGTHDQGVIALLTPDERGEFQTEILDQEPGTIVHEIELADLDGDQVEEVYATRSLPNRGDGGAQPGDVFRYVLQPRIVRNKLVELGGRHAKEILATDLNQDGTDELYIAIEGSPRTQVEIRRLEFATETVVGKLPAMMCRFLSAGDVDGDGVLELVASTARSGVWLLRPLVLHSRPSLIDAMSSGVEHAAALLDLDEDGRAELYVASDDQGELRRYTWKSDHEWQRDTLIEYTEHTYITWSISAAPVASLPRAIVQTDRE